MDEERRSGGRGCDGGGMLSPTDLLAQATASLHGHVQNAAGQPVTKGDVKLTTDKTSEPAKTQVPVRFSPRRERQLTPERGWPRDTYLAMVFQDEKSLDFNDSVEVKANDNKTLDFDMTRTGLHQTR